MDTLCITQPECMSSHTSAAPSATHTIRTVPKRCNALVSNLSIHIPALLGCALQLVPLEAESRTARSPARRNAHADRLAAEGCRVFSCPINRKADLAAVLAAVQPHVCVFDR